MYITPGSGQGNSEDGASMRGLDSNSVSFIEVHDFGITVVLLKCACTAYGSGLWRTVLH